MAVGLFLLPFFGALAAAAAGMRRPSWTRPIALGALGLQTALAAVLAGRGVVVEARMGGWPAPLGIEWSLSGAGAAFAVLVSGLAFIALAASRETAEEELRGREGPFYACALLLVAGLVGMLATTDLFNFFVHLELSSLAAYALAAHGGPGAPRAALRYLVTGSLGAAFYLLGVGHLYAATGHLGLAEVSARLAQGADPVLTSLGAAFVVTGLAVKMGCFPLHGWMPEAYARCSAPAAALMAPLVTKVAAFSLLRLLLDVFGPDFLRSERVLAAVLACGGGLAAVVGAARAAREGELRRLLAWSSVSQAGLVAMGAGLASRSAVVGALLLVAADAAAKTVLFVSAALLQRRFGISRIDDLPRARGAAPWTAAAVSVAALSLLGLPPLPGFFGKWHLLRAALEAGRFELVATLVLAGLGSAVYVFRILERLYFGSAPASAHAREGPRTAVALNAALALLGVVVLGLACGSLADAAARAGLPGGL